MTALFKPMLAAKPEPEEMDAALANLTFPLLGSPKLDGIRCMVQGGKLYSRALKLIRNEAMQNLWSKKELEGVDGELIVGPPTAEDCFNRSTSTVMSRDKPADEAAFHVFDRYHDAEGFMLRHNKAKVLDFVPGVKIVKHVRLRNLEELLAYEERMLLLGHEGVMLRGPDGRYKQGRSTLKEGGRLIAVKRFVDAEAVVLDTYEQEMNTNSQEVNELGRSKRSSHKAGMVGKDTLGGFVVAMYGDAKDSTIDWHGAFNIGTGKGLTDALRAKLWTDRKKLIGKIVKFRYQKVGTKDAPRIPVFLGFRDKGDLS